MKEENKIWMLFDGRYRDDMCSAICLETCKTLKEARENAIDYGDDTVIVESIIIGNQLEKSKIIN